MLVRRLRPCWRQEQEAGASGAQLMTHRSKHTCWHGSAACDHVEARGVLTPVVLLTG